MNDINPRQKISKGKMRQNNKVRDLLLNLSEKKLQFTHVSVRMNLILLFEDTTSISMSGPLSKERRIAAHANPEMSRTVMQLQ